MFRFLAAAVLMVLTTPVLGQEGDPIAARQALMKQNGKDAKAGGEMLKGVTPFDAARAQVILLDMNAVAGKFGNFFPKGSEVGGDTKASPAIWTKAGEFKAALAKFQADTAAAVASKPMTVAAFGQQFGTVTANCKSCHEAFRVKQD
jgi:cytochrome c556